MSGHAGRSWRLHLVGLVGDANTGRHVRAEATGKAGDPDRLGRRVADALIDQGASTLIAASAEPDTGPFAS